MGMGPPLSAPFREGGDGPWAREFIGSGPSYARRGMEPTEPFTGRTREMSPLEPTARGPLLLGVGLLALVYFVVSFSLSILRLEEFTTSTWDLGIFQQALWSAGHGRLLWEAPDYEFYGVHSFLEVHPAPLLLALAPLYALAPQAGTLFVIQSLVVALAAFPLALLGTHLSGSWRKGLLGAGIYLAQAGLLGANLYDFHLESFLPLEIFSFVLLWERRAYLAAGGVALLTMLTLEVGPVLLFFFGIFFAVPVLEDLRASWAEAGRGGRGFLGSLRRMGASLFREPKGRAAILLSTACVVGYLLLRVLQSDLVPGLLGSGSVRPLVGVGAAGLGLSWANLAIGFPQRVTYWVLALSMVGFLPLRVPRTWILSAPWIAFTALSSNVAFASLGFQYDFLTVTLLMVGTVYGLARLPLSPLPSIRNVWMRLRGGRGERRKASSAGARAPSQTGRPWMWVLLGVILLNLLLSPVNPLMQENPPGTGYQVSYTVGPGYDRVLALVAQIPRGAVVLATTDLFPLVANDVNAYSFLWYPSPPPHLPFSPGNLPTYVLASSSHFPTVMPWLAGLLENGTTYVVVGAVAPTPTGTVTLWILAQGAGPAGTAVGAPGEPAPQSPLPHILVSAAPEETWTGSSS